MGFLPTTGWHAMRARATLVTLAVIASGSLASCGHFARIASLELHSMSGFQTHVGDFHVYFESGAEAAADAVVAGLDAAARQIEASHRAALSHRPEIYVCATAECYTRYAFTPSARAETRPFGRTVILQGRLLIDEQRLLPVLTHELSHAFWFQRGIRCHPRWWVEGLAVESSGGGGAEATPHATAALALRDGTRFTDLEESCWVRDSAKRAGVTWPMFYRQAEMFVGWLRARDGLAFGSTLDMLQDGAALTPAIESSFAVSLPALWQAWQRSVAEATP